MGMTIDDVQLRASLSPIRAVSEARARAGKRIHRNRGSSHRFLLSSRPELFAMPAPPKSRRPTLRRLAIFDAVIRTGSAGAAAREIGLSQPAVTHALDKLESEVGGRLFDRGPGG